MTTQNSTQYAAQTSNPPTIAEAHSAYGKVRFFRVNFTQTGAGTDGSVARLIKLPPGKLAYLGDLSWLHSSDMGTGRTMDIGWAQYRDINGDVVTADPNGLHTAQDVSPAAVFQAGDALADGIKIFESLSGVTIIATVNGDTFPNGATVQGIIAIGVE
jgi:hypothetical protein